MKPSSKVLLWVALLLLFAVAAFVLLRGPQESDQAQIAGQLEAARSAGERQNIGGVMKVISADYHDQNIPGPTQLRFLLNKVRGTQAVKITQSLPVISVSGDAATSTSHLEVISVGDGRVLYSHDLVAQWKREESPRLLIFPGNTWRIVSADYGSFGLE